MRKKKLFSFRCVYASVFSIIFFCSLSTYAQPKVDWSLSYPKAANVNVGSGKHSEIEIKFELADEPLPGGVIRITIPNAPNDFYEASKPAYNAGGAGAITLGTPTYSGGVLTFPAYNFTVGKTLHYMIPHRAIDNLPVGVTNGSVLIEVLDNTNTPVASGGSKTANFNYRRANLTVVNPSVLATDQSGLSLNFGNNNGSHTPGTNTTKEYRFGLKTSNGSIDSVRVKLTIPTIAATITAGSWKCNNVVVDRVVPASSGGNTTYTLYLTKAHSIGGDGFDDGELADISLEAKKTYCGNTTLNLSAAWGSASDYVISSSVPGSFAANSSSGSPTLARISMTTTTSNPWNADGITPNEMITIAKNTGTGEACDIIYNLSVFSNTNSPQFLDVNAEYSVDNGVTFTPVTATASARGAGSGAYVTNPTYRPKPANIQVRIPEKLDPGKELHIKWKFYIAPDMFSSAAGNLTDRDWLRLVRFDDSWSYTDLCRSATSNIGSAGVYSTAEYLKGTNFGPTITLNALTPSQDTKLYQLAFTAHGDNRLSTAGACVVVNLNLPKGVKITNTGSYNIRLTDADGISNIWNYASVENVDLTDAIYNKYSFKFTQRSAATKYLNVELEQDCGQSGIVPGLRDFNVTFDYYPTGTIGTGANVKMTAALQFYNQLSLSCSSTGLTYSLGIERKTLGLRDTNNDGIPDISLEKLNNTHPEYTTDVDHKQLLDGDTVLLRFKGKIMSGGEEYVYAVVFSQVDQDTYSILNGDVTVSGTNTYNAQLLNPSVDANNRIVPYSLTGIAPKNKAYIWKITKTSGGSTFAANELVNLDVPFKAVNSSGSYLPIKYKVGSWFYSSLIDLGTDVNFSSGTNPGNPGSNRRGDEEYAFTTIYFMPYHGGWSSATTLNFSGPQTRGGSFYINPAYGDYPGWTPYEFRTLATTDTLYVNVPDGYRIDNTMTFDHNGDNGTVTITADPLNSTKTRKAFAIKDKYITGAGIYTATATANTDIRIIEGQYRIQAYPRIISTPRTPVGTKNMTMTSLVDRRTYTHAYMNNPSRLDWGSTALVFAEGPGVNISTTDAAAKNLGAEHMSWNISLNNTFGSSINEMWLYIEGPVKNVKFNSAVGQGEGGRWIKLNGVTTSGITDNLSFDVIPDNGCTNKTIKIYPIFDNSNPATFSPFGGTQTDAAFNASSVIDGDDFDKFVYRELVLTINTVASKIEGSITDWFNTPSDPAVPTSPSYGEFGVDKGRPFTVEVVFDASGSAGPVTNPSASMNFPKGLEYHVDSAYIEYKGTVIKITDNSWINNLNLLTGDNNPHNGLVFNLKDLYTTQSTVLTPLFGDNATIEAGTKAYFRFKLMPTCEIALTGERIGAVFSGKRFCDFATPATNNGQTITSDQLTLLNPMIGFRSSLSLTPSLDTLMCEPGRDIANMTLRFHKKNKSAEAMAATDSIRIAIPSDLHFNEKITYSYPAYNLNSLNIPAESGVFTSGEISSYLSTDGKTRYLAWQVPYAYLNTLATQSVANDSVNAYFIYTFTLKAGVNPIRIAQDTKIHAATIAQYGVHATCPNNILAEADSSDQRVVLAPSKNALLTDLYVNDLRIEEFNPGVFEYNVVLPCGTEKASVSGTPYSHCADVWGTYDEPLERRFKRFEVNVTAEDRIHTQKYVVNLRPLMPAKILEDLPEKMIACQSIDYSMQILAEGDSLTYQWYYENDSVSGANSNKLMISNPQMLTDYGRFYAVVNGACQSADTSFSSRLWVADKLPAKMNIEDIPETVYTGERYRLHVGFDYGYADVTKYIWTFCDTTENCLSLGEGYPGQTFYTNFPGTLPGVLRVDLEHPCAAYFGPYYAEKTLNVINKGTGIDGINDDKLSVYPNPFEDELHIVSENKLESIVVTDISGRRVASYLDILETEFTIQAHSWAKGTYLITIKSEEGTRTHKVVKK